MTRSTIQQQQQPQDLFAGVAQPGGAAGGNWQIRAARLKAELNRHAHGYYVLDPPTNPVAE